TVAEFHDGEQPEDLPYFAVDRQQLQSFGVSNTDDIQEIYRLTPLQKGMLFHTIYDPEAGSYVYNS
uniref:hypothetical protein n=1 Tax=Paenibacillus sp. JCM 10914 TaxID=1236974 RepID=UPI000B256017